MERAQEELLIQLGIQEVRRRCYRVGVRAAERSVVRDVFHHYNDFDNDQIRNRADAARQEAMLREAKEYGFDSLAF